MDRTVSSNLSSPFSVLGFWFCNSFRSLRTCGAYLSNGLCLKRSNFDGKVVSNSPNFVKVKAVVLMEGEMGKNVEGMEERKRGLGENGNEIDIFVDLSNEGNRESCSSSGFLASEEATRKDEQIPSSNSEESISSHSVGWPIIEQEEPRQCACSDVSGNVEKPHLNDKKILKQEESLISEIEMMKARFSKLLLGEDMSGSGNGVCTALAISNALTNLCATVFGQIWRLEPLTSEKKLMWRREMQWLLCVSDHIVELIPSWQTFPDGSKLEVMTCRPRSDLYVNLPALRKLDNMLLEILDSFENTEFWYVDQGVLTPDAGGSSSFRGSVQREEEKWWLPVPRVPPGGLLETSRKHLQHKRDCTNQILKAAMAINSITLAEMEVPDSYLEALPKNGRACLGDLIHQYITSDQFYPENLLACLDLSSEHQALEMVNRVEASIYLWRRRNASKPINSTSRSTSKSSWEIVKDLMVDTEKRDLLADRAECLLLCLKQRFPGLPQTTLDMTKIQCNKDVGKSILESYSRVLESLAFNIVARIDDLLYVDDLAKHSDQFSSTSKVGVVSCKSVMVPYSVPVPGTPYQTPFSTPNFSPCQIRNIAMGDRSPLVDNSNLPHPGLCAKKVLIDYLSIDTKGNACGNPLEGSAANSDLKQEATVPEMEQVSMECRKEVLNSVEEDELCGLAISN